jgi:DNA-binding winged helix-turn-helix (wHTH) protein/DNA polymerase III delta prime subunit
MVLAFGDFELDEELYALRRRGRPVKLEPKVFDVLAFLLRRRARVVTKEELLDALWPGEAVSESVLPRCIAAARRAVGDTRRRGIVIQTLHRRGYRFVAPVTETGGVPPAVEPRAPFVGRDKLLAALRADLDTSAAGHLRVVLLAGEPGIGKTRTLAELAREALMRGTRWLEGRCYEGEGAPAFWPWVQVLRELVADVPASALAAELGPGAADVAELLPELRRRLPRLARPDDMGSDQARFRVFESIAALLVRASARIPLAVALDDLHWGDADSLRLLDFVAAARRTAPILLVGAYRDVEVRRDRPLARLLGALAGRTNVERLELRGLDRDAVMEMVTAVAGQPRPDVGMALAERTAGNPFFVTELLRLMDDEGRLAAGTEALPGLALPQGVRDAVGRRLDRLSPACNDVLRAAAVAGRGFDLRVLSTLVEAPREALLELLAEAQGAGILVAPPDGTGRLAFSHALIHQALYDELSMPRRVALHRRAGQALESLYAGREDAPAAEIAHHFFESSTGGEAGRAVDWCERAADRALSLCAYDDGARHLARALEALDHGEPDAGRRAALLTRLDGWRSPARPARWPSAWATARSRRSPRRSRSARTCCAANGPRPIVSWRATCSSPTSCAVPSFACWRPPPSPAGRATWASSRPPNLTWTMHGSAHAPRCPTSMRSAPATGCGWRSSAASRSARAAVWRRRPCRQWTASSGWEPPPVSCAPSRCSWPVTSRLGVTPWTTRPAKTSTTSSVTRPGSSRWRCCRCPSPASARARRPTPSPPSFCPSATSWCRTTSCAAWRAAWSFRSASWRWRPAAYPTRSPTSRPPRSASAPWSCVLLSCVAGSAWRRRSTGAADPGTGSGQPAPGRTPARRWRGSGCEPRSSSSGR